MIELVNETVGRYRDWGYSYYIVDRDHMFESSAYLALPQGSYMYRARISNQVVWIAQIPWGTATSEFLLVHASSVIRALPAVLQGSQS